MALSTPDGLAEAWDAARSDWRRMAKPRAIEDPGDTYLIRPLGFLLVQALRHTPITPNAVSALSVVVAAGSAWAFYLANVGGAAVRPALVGSGLFLLYSALDSADGQLARLTGQRTELGRVLDALCDHAAFLLVYVAILAGHLARGGDRPLVVALLGLAAMASHSVHAAASEYHRALYLHYVHGSGVVRDEDPRRLRESLDDAGTRRGGRLAGSAGRWIGLLQLGYSTFQRTLCRSSHELWRRIEAARRRRGVTGETDLDERLPEAYRRRQGPMLSRWALLGPNAHKLGVVVAAFVPPLAASGGSPAPWWAGLGMAWFFVFDIGLNVVLVALLLGQARIDRRLEESLGLPD